jgi:hypothetical protein
MIRRVVSGIELNVKTLVIVAALLAIRGVLLALGFDGMASTALSTGIIAGGIFVMGLVVAGTLSDYKDAERAPTDIAAGLHALLREGESMHAAWGKPDISELRRRLIAVVTSLRVDIDAGDSRTARRLSRTCRRPSSNSRIRTSRRTTSSGSAPSRPACARHCCGSTTCNARSSSPRRTR